VGAPAPDILAFLARRRSVPAQTLTAPGPDAGELAEIIRLAARVPDHGKLAPWRFIVVEGAAKTDLLEKLTALAQGAENPTKANAVLGKLRAPPVTVAVVSRPNPAAAIPVWEQEMSAGAVCMLMLMAAQAMGYGANWITDWYAYDPAAVALLGLGPQEKVAGFIHFGTASTPPAERERPDLSTLVSHL
jgi:nitroreductase